MAPALRISTDPRPLSARSFIGQRFNIVDDLTAALGDVHEPIGPALVVFYRGDWCEYCREQLVELTQQTDAFLQFGVRILAVTTDDDEGRQQMLDRIEHRFPIVPDPHGDLVRAVDLIDPFELRTVPVSLPAVFLIDRFGILQYHYVGRSPEDRPRIELLLLAAERLALGKC
jgi:peroxiredoxin